MKLFALTSRDETSSSLTGKSAITDGKLESDTLVFTIDTQFDGNPLKLKCAGEVKPDEISFHIESADIARRRLQMARE
ncbi:MAG: hypothetical protein H7039_23040 [Bryobacteraceae bacterium]|nr:hypothetical protein [Bryobacteraceae bacterium]